MPKCTETANIRKISECLSRGALKDNHSARNCASVSALALFHSDPILSRTFPEKHNAAPAEYVRWAALLNSLGPQIPSMDMSAIPAPGFDHDVLKRMTASQPFVIGLRRRCNVVFNEVANMFRDGLAGNVTPALNLRGNLP
jgi:hypothetical protein